MLNNDAVGAGSETPVVGFVVELSVEPPYLE